MPEKLGFGLFYQIDNVNFNLKDNDFLLNIFSDEFIKVKKQVALNLEQAI